MSLFDEIRRQIQEAIDEAQGGPAKRPVPPRPQARVRPVEAAATAPPPPPVVKRPAPRVRRRPIAALSDRAALLRTLRDPQRTRQAILLAEILDRPRALRPFRPR